MASQNRSFRVVPPNASAPSAECERHPRSLIWQALVLGAASGLFESVSRLTGAFCMLAEGVGGIEMRLAPVTAPVLGPHRYAARLIGSDCARHGARARSSSVRSATDWL
jgi:hypothetical protein